MKGVAVEGLSKALLDAVKAKSSLPVEQLPVLELTWQISKLKEVSYSAKVVQGRTSEWVETTREIFTENFRGVRSRRFITIIRSHENPQGTVYESPFDPQVIGNFTFECRERRGEDRELISRIEASVTVELFLMARNFNVPVTERGLNCEVIITEQSMPTQCPQQPGLERSRPVRVNVRWNNATVLPGVPEKSYVLNAIKEGAVDTWD